MTSDEICFKIQNLKDLKKIFEELYLDFETNNNSYFHINEIGLSEEERKILSYKQFLSGWSNFNHQKKKLLKFLKKDPFQRSRKIIKEITIDYQIILNEIIAYNAMKKTIPYSYVILVRKFISLIFDFYYKQINLQTFDVNLRENLLNICYIKNNVYVEKRLRLFKFIQKAQIKNPEIFKHCKTYLVISNNWKDVFFQSTFKSWRSCLNLINFYFIDKDIANSPLNNVRSNNYVAYLILNIDNKSINEIMDDITPNRIMLSKNYLEM